MQCEKHHSMNGFVVVLSFLGLPLLAAVEVEMVASMAVLHDIAELPCNITPPLAEDAIQLVLWYKEGEISPPIYSFDVRGRPFSHAVHWHDANALGHRASFRVDRGRSHLVLNPVMDHDQGLYRCRVDFRYAATRNILINLTIIGTALDQLALPALETSSIENNTDDSRNGSLESTRSNTSGELEAGDWMEIIRRVSEDTGTEEEQVIKEIQKLINYKTFFSLEKKKFEVNCSLCISFGNELLKYIDWSWFDFIRLNRVKDLCHKLGLFPKSVCDPIIDVQGEILHHVARKTDITPKIPELCSNLIKDNCDESKGDDWSVELPDVQKPPVQPILPPEIGKPTLKVLQLSDIHLDPIYEAGADADCEEPICCRNGAAGVPGNGVKGNAGIWGSYECDAPIGLVWDMLQHISRNHKDIDYAFLIGDALAHDVWMQDKNMSMKNQALVNSLVREGLPGVQVYPIIGNHDTYPVNNFPPRDEELLGHELFDISWLVEATWNDWTNQWLPAELKNNSDMYYSLQILPGLRLIALNSNYFYIMNWWNMYYTEDPSGQLAWLVKELQDAEDKGEKVQLLIHQPPGADAYKTYSHNFRRIVERYENTIRGIFAGHTHAAEFQLLFDSEDPERATAVTYVGPSVTAWENFNPGYRIYTVDGNYEGSSFAILEFEDYYVDLTEANLDGRPRYRKLYSPKEAYKMDDLTPQSWKKVVDSFKSDESQFIKYYKFWHRDSPTQPACDGECRRNHICDIVNADASDSTHCDSVPHF